MKIAVRVDSGTHIGVGHVMRCLTLIEYLASKVPRLQVVFICRDHPGNLARVIEQKGYSVELLEIDVQVTTSSSLPEYRRWLAGTPSADAILTKEVILSRFKAGADWLIVDHYGIDAIWEKQLSGFVHKIMVIDDLADRSHVCDVLLDQTYCETEDRYIGLVPTETKLLIGTQYALLRKEFDIDTVALKKDRSRRGSRNLLVSLGGADPDNSTEQVLDALDEWRDRFEKITIVLGHANPHLKSVTRKANALNAEVLQGVDNLAQLICEHDLAIGASGISSWERCALGMPTVVVKTADNQETVLEKLEKTPAIQRLEPPYTRAALKTCVELLSGDDEAYLKAVSSCFKICDSKGAERATRCLLNQSVHLAHAKTSDCDLVYSIQRRPGIRKFFRNVDVPEYKEHCEWFDKSLKNEGRELFLIEFADKKVGVIRLDKQDAGLFEVSVLIDPEYHGLGIASMALSIIKTKYNGKKLLAFINPKNSASINLFENAGFRFDGTRYTLQL